MEEIKYDVNTMRRSVNHIFLWLLLYNLISFGVTVLIGIFEPFQDEYLLIIICTLAGTALMYLCTYRKWPVRPFARSRKKMTARDFFTILGVFGITQLLTLCVGLFTDAMGIEGTSIDVAEVTIALVIYAVITGPLVEELVYRGFTIGNGRILGKIPVIVMAAFAFGIMHGNLSQFIIGFLGGLVLGFAFAEYSIWWSLLIHILNNGIGVLTMVLPVEFADTVGILFYVAFGVCGIYAVIQIIKRWPEVRAWFADEDNKGSEGAVRSIIASPWFIIFTVIYVAMIVLLMVFPEFSMISATA